MNAYLTYDRIEDRRWVEQQLTDEKPVIWQRTGKSDKTHWVIFVKGGPNVPANSTGSDLR